MEEPSWLNIARELQALAQTGLAFTKDVYDAQRFERIRELAAMMMAQGSQGDMQEILALFRQDVGYATPKIDVRGAVIVDGRILMAREASDGCWSLPGGWADVNQSAAECVVREITEETGYETRAIKLAAVWDRGKQGHQPPHPDSTYKLFFICELLGGEARTSIETTEVGFFAPDALPQLSRGRILPEQIHRMFAHANDPQLPADFE